MFGDKKKKKKKKKEKKKKQTPCVRFRPISTSAKSILASGPKSNWLKSSILGDRSSAGTLEWATEVPEPRAGGWVVAWEKPPTQGQVNVDAKGQWQVGTWHPD